MLFESSAGYRAFFIYHVPDVRKMIGKYPHIIAVFVHISHKKG